MVLNLGLLPDAKNVDTLTESLNILNSLSRGNEILGILKIPNSRLTILSVFSSSTGRIVYQETFHNNSNLED
jgi:hypothetical protein